MHERDSHVVALMYIRITCCIYHKYMHKLKHNHNHEGTFDNFLLAQKKKKQPLHMYGAVKAKVILSVQSKHGIIGGFVGVGCSNTVCMVLGWEISKNFINVLVAGEELL